MGHYENYRWSNIDRSRFDSVRVNVEVAKKVVDLRRHYIEERDIKIAPGISHTVYPPKG